MARKKAAISVSDLTCETVLTALQAGKKPMTSQDLLRELGISRRLQKKLVLLLEELQETGRALRLSGGLYTAVACLKKVRGILEVQRGGMGFVLSSGKKSDIYVGAEYFNGAWNGDEVEVVLLPGKRGKNPEGRVIRVLRHQTAPLAVRVIKRMGKEGVLAQPLAQRHTFFLLVNVDALENSPVKGAVLLVHAGRQLEPQVWAAVAFEYLGIEDSPVVQERITKANHEIPSGFGQAVLEEVAKLPFEPQEEEFTGRRDLRNLKFVTIDGENAKDFDDAVYVEPKRNGWTLWVAIADVSHYVLPQSALDKEALQRSNSYYFPLSVEPMLPEALSNGLCSLRPGVPRLAMVVQMHFSPVGTPGECSFYPAVIQSQQRLTYTQVARVLENPNSEPEDSLLRPLLPMLISAKELAHVLQKQMKERGSLDFELPEPEFSFNEHGDIVHIDREERNFAHQIIEMFMIAANEAVATFLTERKEPFLYRVHPAPDPDKLTGLFAMMRQTGIVQLPKEQDDAALRVVLREAAREGGTVSYIINRLVLRTMMQARYDGHNQGHFGLASDCYCHFTSPIRRYADLATHRALKSALLPGTARSGPDDGILQEIADVLNKNERKAQDAEREIQKRLSVLFLRKYVGDTFSGTISGITEFGIFVELSEVMAEGMIRVASLADDYYLFLPERLELVGERTGRRFALGQSVTVRLVSASIDQLEITLEMAEDRTPKKLRAALLRRGRSGQSSASKTRSSREFRSRAPRRERGKK